MKKLLILCGALAMSTLMTAQDLPEMTYDIDISQNLDTFFVTLSPASALDKSANIYQFAATAPGTYQTMNMGRYVSSFQAYDKKGKELRVIRKSVNQFEINKPHKLTKITYRVAETFDTQVEDFPVYLMCGSSIEEDHALINAHTIMGYFEGYQKSPLRISVKGKDNWKVGTALSRKDGYFLASNFDHAVDSPILMGELSFADTTIADTPVEIYTYSQQGKFDSKSLLADMSDMLDATLQFLVKLPVDRYTFLYFFEPGPTGTTGAWEHSYSSEYVLDEQDPSPEYMEKVTDIASHEFFHIVTPLNIHSKIVESFNFVSPTPSVHLWMYEGVTEWASNMLLYRGGVVEEEDYLQNAIANKILVDEKYFDETWSLKKLSDESFNGGTGARQYGNIYYRGSLVAGLLDVRLLELSGGQSGLRELMLKLIDQYGKGKPVSEKTFFDDLTAMTYPEIRDFFDQYILEANPLPHEEYLAKIGLELTRSEAGISVTKMEERDASQKMLFEAWSKNL
ncbi:peptidase [Marinoscillum sp.]|uniref:M61 family metallopeptidase n=1 Tax=Marinoscillum sp. TaxID=2024838 RepID=UPI003BAD400F